MAISAGGRCHAILARLAEGPAHTHELGKLIRRPGEGRRFADRELDFRVATMRQDGLLRGAMKGLLLTPAGHDLARRLGPTAASAAYAPTVRIFVQQQAGA